MLLLPPVVAASLGRGPLGTFGAGRTIVTRLQGMLGDRAGHPFSVFTEPRVSYGCPQGEQHGREGGEA